MVAEAATISLTCGGTRCAQASGTLETPDFYDRGGRDSGACLRNERAEQRSRGEEEENAVHLPRQTIAPTDRKFTVSRARVPNWGYDL